MLRSDIPEMAKQLNRVADVYDRKPLTDGAVEAWFDTLKEFRTELVQSVLINVPKREGKWPTPHAVWKICNEAEIDRREAMRKSEDAIREKEIEFLGATERGREIIDGIRKILRKPRLTPIQHWQRIIDAPLQVRQGDPGYPIDSKEMAREALSKLMGESGGGQRIPSREPGED